MYQLSQAQYDSVRSLFGPLRYHLASAAVLDGNSPGRVFVDNLARPQSVFMMSPEGCYLAGDPEDTAFNRAFNRSIVSERVLGDELRVLFLVVDPEGWRGRLPSLLAPIAPLEMRRRHYVCASLSYDWRAHVSGKYQVLRIDTELLSRPGLTISDHVTGWMVNNWGSTDRFMRDGFGFLTLDGSEVVSWSLSDCVSGDLCEIGIRTVPTHRRRGLATLTAAASVEHALSHGYAMVGWHCPEDNLGSIGTAEKVGFQRERDYSAYYALLDQ